jgi:hemerythrin-like domain-containing protein
MKFDPPSSADSEILDLARRKGWPQDMCELLQRYPREQWQGHANLGEMATFWLQRHAMFRELAGMVERIADDFRGGALTATRFPQLFVPRLQFLLQQLDVHHQIEDIHYFPIFRAADNRLARGFDVLEEDHHAIHAGMAETAETAKALLRVLQGDADRLRRCGDDYAVASGQLLRFLMRHLDDEEDLIVPLILDRGEAALGVRHL